jgi:hypothetical protein
VTSSLHSLVDFIRLHGRTLVHRFTGLMDVVCTVFARLQQDHSLNCSQLCGSRSNYQHSETQVENGFVPRIQPSDSPKTIPISNPVAAAAYRASSPGVNTRLWCSSPRRARCVVRAHARVNRQARPIPGEHEVVCDEGYPDQLERLSWSGINENSFLPP